MSAHLLLGLFTKHFICDFPLQASPWMYKNKGTYGHPGGIQHALIHCGGTAVVLYSLGVEGNIGAPLAILDGIAHYHIDWAKMNLGARLNLKPDNSEWFWILLGFDQYLHALTYFAIAYLVKP